MVKSYEDLLVGQEAIELAKIVYRATTGFPVEERYGLTSQMRRAAVSIPSNVAEGQARTTRGEFIQFLGHARGSLAELDTQTILAGQLGMLSEHKAGELRQQVAKVGKLLSGLRRSLTSSHQPPATSHQPLATSHQPRATSHEPLLPWFFPVTRSAGSWARTSSSTRSTNRG